VLRSVTTCRGRPPGGGPTATAGSVRRGPVQITERVGAAPSTVHPVLAALGTAVPGIPRCAFCWRFPCPRPQCRRCSGIGDFALRRSYATVLIDAATGQRADVLPGRTADVVEAWLREHPGIQIVCRDGSGAYAEAVRRALPPQSRPATAGT
jgi:Transposase